MLERQNPDESPLTTPDAPTRHFPWATLALGIGLIASLAAVGYQHMNLVNVRMEMGSLQREIDSMKQSLASSGVEVEKTVNSLRSDLESTKKETVATAREAKEVARRHAENVASKVTTELAARQDEQKKAISDEIEKIRTTADQQTVRLTDITTEVGAVKTEVSTTRSDLDKTIASLNRTTGDLGVMSGLIATNSKELAALKELGERDYFEFTANKNSPLLKVSDIQLTLKKADPKKNRYTLVVVADDKTVEKKDRNVNEPVQFYVVSKARQPYEIVINEVKKDQIVGYLATPKVKATAARKL